MIIMSNHEFVNWLGVLTIGYHEWEDCSQQYGKSKNTSNSKHIYLVNSNKQEINEFMMLGIELSQDQKDMIFDLRKRLYRKICKTNRKTADKINRKRRNIDIKNYVNVFDDYASDEMSFTNNDVSVNWKMELHKMSATISDIVRKFKV